MRHVKTRGRRGLDRIRHRGNVQKLIVFTVPAPHFSSRCPANFYQRSEETSKGALSEDVGTTAITVTPTSRAQQVFGLTHTRRSALPAGAQLGAIMSCATDLFFSLFFFRRNINPQTKKRRTYKHKGTSKHNHTEADGSIVGPVI